MTVLWLTVKEKKRCSRAKHFCSHITFILLACQNLVPKLPHFVWRWFLLTTNFFQTPHHWILFIFRLFKLFSLNLCWLSWHLLGTSWGHAAPSEATKASQMISHLQLWFLILAHNGASKTAASSDIMSLDTRNCQAVCQCVSWIFTSIITNKVLLWIFCDLHKHSAGHSQVTLYMVR